MSWNGSFGMNTAELSEFFEERAAEIAAYLRFLDDLETAAQGGPPRFEGVEGPISAPQQKILYSSLYLQLYNLVEATVSNCLEAVATATVGQWRPSDLNDSLRSEWIRFRARTHVDLTPEHRLQSAVDLFEHLMQQLPVQEFKVELGGGGNWDDESIRVMTKRVGCEFKLKRATEIAVKRKFRDDMGALKLVRDRRNALAHGNVSFVECSDDVGVPELRQLTDAVVVYLREATTSFVGYIESQDFLRASARRLTEGA